MGETILYVSGGAMSAVFSVGVLHQLETLGVRDEISAIYGVSAGALNAAFFAAGNAKNALEWYTRFVAEDGLIKHHNPFSVMRGIESLDMNKAEQMLTERKLLDVQALVHSHIPVYAKVLHAKTREVSYLDVRCLDAVKILRASATLVPFADKPTIVDGEPYIDGAISESIGIERLRALHPGARFIIIVNDEFAEYSFRRFLQWAVIRSHDADLAAAYRINSGAAGAELALIRASEDCLLFEPPPGYAVSNVETEKTILEAGFASGCAAVDAAHEKLHAFLTEQSAEEYREKELTHAVS